jgi:hypothetical protein
VTSKYEEGQAVTFDEFRVWIQPDIQNPNVWSILVDKCELPEVRGPHGAAAPIVTAADLSLLRNATAPPNLQGLKQLGQAVLDTIMPPQVQLGFRLCLAQALRKQRGLRLVVVMLGNARTAGGIGLHELPVEAAFSQQLDFIATNVRTPLSRGVVAEPDRDAVQIALPVRVLVVASEPSDMSPVHAHAEQASILQALAPLIQSRAVVVDFCNPPTLIRLDAKLREGYHVVHFIGHGDFEIAGADPNPQPHLYFEDGTSHRRRHAADAEQIYTTLRNGNVPLVVLTACSTAAASPNGQDYPGVAFESLAQALVERQSGPLAAIAMQFDFETQAAKIFSRALYERLLTPRWGIDEAVAAARVALIAHFGAGHRSWVNPTVYWRCKEGRVFDLLDTAGDLSDAQRQALLQIDAQLDVYYTQMNDLARESQDIRALLAGLRAQWQAKIEDLLSQRGLVLGDTVRLRGGLPKSDGTIECTLTLRLRLPATVGDVRADVQYDPAEFTLVGKSQGQHAPAGAWFVQENPDAPTAILVQNASLGAIWTPGEYELVKLQFRLANPASKPLFYIQLVNASVNRNNAPQAFQTLHAVVFGS